jgi:hypothetical protein
MSATAAGPAIRRAQGGVIILAALARPLTSCRVVLRVRSQRLVREIERTRTQPTASQASTPIGNMGAIR